MNQHQMGQVSQQAMIHQVQQAAMGENSNNISDFIP